MIGGKILELKLKEPLQQYFFFFKTVADAFWRRNGRCGPPSRDGGGRSEPGRAAGGRQGQARECAHDMT